MAESIVVVNAGSSSVKFALFALTSGQPHTILKGEISGIGTSTYFQAKDDKGNDLPFLESSEKINSHDDAIEALINWLTDRGESLVGAGHRVVHGGTDFTAPVRIDEDVCNSLQALTPMAPHHQPHNLAAIRALSARHPELPQVACFDTAFHASQPTEARELGLPREYADRGLRRYGFHGLSYESVITALPGTTGERLPSRLVISHLGNGASMCAVRNGKCIATTMGFSTLDGIPMGTRCGSMDPGVLLHLMREDGANLADLEDLLYNKCGLLGVSGLSQDMRTLLSSDQKKAKEAVAFFCYRIARELGSLSAALGGLDALVFTGGIGENSAQVRAQVLQLSHWLGLQLNENDNATGKVRITLPDSPVVSWVVPTDEETTIARHTRRVLAL